MWRSLIDATGTPSATDSTSRQATELVGAPACSGGDMRGTPSTGWHCHADRSQPDGWGRPRASEGPRRPRVRVTRACVAAAVRAVRRPTGARGAKA
eukprot:366502-Chlamydomonas_euryale.AAC.6